MESLLLDVLLFTGKLRFDMSQASVLAAELLRPKLHTADISLQLKTLTSEARFPVKSSAKCYQTLMSVG